MVKEIDTNQDIKNFCDNVRRLRRIKRFPQKEMARAMGIGIYSLRKIESGILPPRLTIDCLFRLYEAFGVLPHTLMEPGSIKEPEGK